MSFLADNFPLLRDAFLTTLALAVLSGICALVLGTLLAAMRVSPVTPAARRRPRSTSRSSGTPR